METSIKSTETEETDSSSPTQSSPSTPTSSSTSPIWPPSFRFLLPQFTSPSSSSAINSKSSSPNDQAMKISTKTTVISDSFATNTNILSRPGTYSSGNAKPFWKPSRKVPGTIKLVSPDVGTSPLSSTSSPVSSFSLETPSPNTSFKPFLSQSSNSFESSANNTASSYTNCVELSSSKETVQQCISPASTTLTEEIYSSTRLKKFQKVLNANNVDIVALRKLSWQGIPGEVRAMTWKLLLEYLPSNRDRRNIALERKRKDYSDCIPKYFDVSDSERTSDERGLFRQIQIDVPRTLPNVVLFHNSTIQQSLARILYTWSIRHPASGYVQGINDLATPFYIVFLEELTGFSVDHCNIEDIAPDVLTMIEADSYWCLTRLLDGIQDNYTFAQLGIQRMVQRLSDVIRRVDAPLFEHLLQHDVHFLQFSFRWINCLFMRELPLTLVIRLWDAYFAEIESFASLHLYACAAFLKTFSDVLRQLDFQDIMLFLKNPPTTNWTDKEIELLLSQAYMWKTLFADAPKHLSE